MYAYLYSVGGKRSELYALYYGLRGIARSEEGAYYKLFEFRFREVAVFVPS